MADTLAPPNGSASAPAPAPAPDRSARRAAAWHSSALGDLVLAALVTALVIGETLATRGPATAVALAALAGVCLVPRRRHPLPAYLVGSAALLLLAAHHPDAGLFAVPNIIGLYSVGAHARRGAAVVGLVAGLAVVIAYWSIVGSDAPWLPALTVAAWALAWVAGQGERQRRRAAAEAVRTAAEAERRAETERAAAVAEERARMAREVLDVVGHALTVMVLHAGAARRVHARDPAAGAASLATVEEVGRQALGDLDHALGLLGGAPRQPELGTSALPALVGRIAGSGVAVVLMVRGEPRRLPTAVDLALYRVTQEALTNVLKHAPGRRASVVLTYRGHEVEVAIIDGERGSGASAHDLPHAVGEPTADPPADPRGTGGRGLAGLQARVRNLGGAVASGGRSDGSWEVRCTLPTPA